VAGFYPCGTLLASRVDKSALSSTTTGKVAGTDGNAREVETRVCTEGAGGPAWEKEARRDKGWRVQVEVGSEKVQGEDTMATMGQTGWTGASQHAPQASPQIIHSQGEKAKGLQTEGGKESGYSRETDYSQEAGFSVSVERGLRRYYLAVGSGIDLDLYLIVMSGRLAHKVSCYSRNNVLL
jgi:hypothetical protein